MRIIHLPDYMVDQKQAPAATTKPSSGRGLPVIRVHRSLAKLVKLVASGEEKAEADLLEELRPLIEPELLRRLERINRQFRTKP